MFIVLTACVFGILSNAQNIPYKAAVVVPVADLVGEPLLASSNATCYALPFSGVGNKGCGRIHQVIFNEIVTVLEERENEVRVRIPNFFFELPNSTTRFSDYWMLKHAVVPLSVLPDNAVPAPVCYDALPRIAAPSSVVTLLFPYYDPLTRYTFSAGTRFIVTHVHKQKSRHISAYAYWQQAQKLLTIQLPRELCLVGEPTTKAKKIALFVSLVQQWAALHPHFIPYVLGGCSFTTTCNNDNYTQKETAYYRPDYPHNSVSGLDCTGLIARAAQICGIPYYFKNTTTVAKYLRPIKADEPIENGDIILFTGHALIITDTVTHTCVEARSYDHGFGKVHTLPIHRLFAHIKTLEEIKQAMLQNKPIMRLDSKGEQVQKITTVKILKLASAWQH